MSKTTYKMGRLAVLLVLCVGLASAGMAADIYVDDSNTTGPWNGLTSATAFLTIQEGVDLAANPSSNVGPDTVNVAAGTYAAGALIRNDSSNVTVLGTGTPSVIGPQTKDAGWPAANFLIGNASGAVVTIDGFACGDTDFGVGTWEGAILGDIDAVISNVDVTSVTNQGILVAAPGTVTIDNCTVTSASHGFYVGHWSGGAPGATANVTMSNVTATSCTVAGTELWYDGATVAMNDVTMALNGNGLNIFGTGGSYTVGGTANSFSQNAVCGILEASGPNKTIVVSNAEVTSNGLVAALPGDVTRGCAVAIANGGDATNITLNSCNIHDNGYGNVSVWGIVQTVALNDCTLSMPGLNPLGAGPWYWGCSLFSVNWNNNITMTGGSIGPGGWMATGVSSNTNGPNVLTLDGVDMSQVNEGTLMIGNSDTLNVINGTQINDAAGPGTAIWLHDVCLNGTVNVSDSTMYGPIACSGDDNTINWDNTTGRDASVPGDNMYAAGIAERNTFNVSNSTLYGNCPQWGTSTTLNMTNIVWTAAYCHVDGPGLTANLDNVTLTGGWEGIAAHGNGRDATFNVTDCSITNGGNSVLVQAPDVVVTIDDSTFVANTRVFLVHGDAGARRTDVIVRNSVLSTVDAAAPADQFGLFQYTPDPDDGWLLFEDCTIANSAQQCLYIQGKFDVTIRRCELNGPSGAGVFFAHLANPASLVMEDTTVRNTWMSIGLWVPTVGVDMTITRCSLGNNGASYGIFDSSAWSNLTMTDSEFVNTWHAIWMGVHGWVGSSIYDFTNVRWWTDTSRPGAMCWPLLLRESNNTYTFTDCEIGPMDNGSGAAYNGGHCFDFQTGISDSTATFINSSLHSTNASIMNAVGSTDCTVNLINCDLYDSPHGGMIHADNSTRFTVNMTDSTMDDCGWGMIHVQGTGADFTCNITNSTLTNPRGGWTVHNNMPGTTYNFTDSYFTDSMGPGGNIIQTFGTGLRMNVDHCVFEKRVFATHSIWVGAADNVFNMNNSFMVGGKYYIVWVSASGTGTLVNNTFIGVDNAGDGSDVCVWFRDGSPSAPVTYRNNVAYGFDNVAYDCYCTGGGSRIYQDNATYASAGLANAGFTYPATADMVLQADSALADPHLVTGSPLINAGTFVAGSLGSGTEDYDRQDERVAGPSVDIGADEFVPHLLSIVRDDVTPTESRTLSYTVTFDNPVYGVDPTDFVLGGTPVFYIPDAAAAPLGSIYRMPLADDVFTVTEVGGGVFTVVVDIMAGAGSTSLNLVDDNTIIASATPLNGPDVGTVYVGEVYDITDTVNPDLLTIELINGSPTSRDTVDFRFTFTELMEGPSLVPGSSGLGGVNTHVVTQSLLYGTVANVAVTLADPDLDGTVNAWVDAGLDMVGLPLAANFSSAAYDIDNAVPIIWDIVRTGGALRPADDVQYVRYTVIFDMDVTDADAADFVLTGTYLAGVPPTVTLSLAPGPVTFVAPNYEMVVVVSTGYPTEIESNAGTLRLDTVVAPTIFDAATGTHQLGGPFAGGEEYDITNVPRAPAAVPIWWMFE